MSREKYAPSFAVGLTLGVLAYMSTGRLDIGRLFKKPSENPVIKKEENTNYPVWIEQSYSIHNPRNWVVVYKAANSK